MLEALELQSVSARIAEKHRHLLARLARISDAWLDDERNFRLPNSLGHSGKFVPCQQCTEMRHGHPNTIDHAGIDSRHHRPRDVGRDLMSEEVEVHPGIRAPSFPAAQHATIESPGRGEVTHEESDVESGHR